MSRPSKGLLWSTEVIAIGLTGVGGDGLAQLLASAKLYYVHPGSVADPGDVPAGLSYLDVSR